MAFSKAEGMGEKGKACQSHPGSCPTLKLVRVPSPANQATPGYVHNTSLFRTTAKTWMMIGLIILLE